MDHNIKVRVKPGSTGVDTADVKMSMNPFDEIAIEEAVRLKERGVATEVVAISCGMVQCQETLRTAMAIGADCGILVETDAELQPLATTELFKVLAGREQPTLILLGKQATDDDTSQTGWVLTALAGLPQAAYAFKIDTIGSKITATREADGSLEAVSLILPVVIMTDLRLSGLRYVTLPNTMKTKKKPLDIIQPEDLGVDVASCLKTLKVDEPPRQGAGVVVADVATLVEKFKNEAKVV